MTCRNHSRDSYFVKGVLSKHELLVVVLFVDVGFRLVVEGCRLRPVDLLKRELRVGLEREQLADELDATFDGRARPFDDANLKTKIIKFRNSEHQLDLNKSRLYALFMFDTREIRCFSISNTKHFLNEITTG
jgi:hypothetical protein